MFQRIKKIGGLVALVGIIIASVSFRDGIAGMKSPIDLYAEDTDFSEIGYFDMVTVDVTRVYGAYETITRSRNGVKESEDSYYYIPAYEGDEFRIIGIRINEKEYATVNQIYENTYDFDLSPEELNRSKGVIKTGCLKKMKKKMQNYFYDTLREWQWFGSEEELKEVALPYYVDSVASPKSMVTMFLLGLIAFFAGGIAFVLGSREERKQLDASLDQSIVYLHGISYAKADLAHVNRSVQEQNKENAVRELAALTGLSTEEAIQIIENWRKYYY